MNTYVTTQYSAHKAHPQSSIASYCGQFGVTSAATTDRGLRDYADACGKSPCIVCLRDETDGRNAPANIA